MAPKKCFFRHCFLFPHRQRFHLFQLSSSLDWIGLDHPTAMRRIKEACRRYLYFRSQTMDPPMLILDPPLLGIFLCDIRIWYLLLIFYGLITDRVVRYCCQNWHFRNKQQRSQYADLLYHHRHTLKGSSVKYMIKPRWNNSQKIPLKNLQKSVKNIIWERLFLPLLFGSPSNSLTSEDHNNMCARMDCYQTIFYLQSMIMILKGVIILLGPPSHCFYEQN